MEFPELGNHCGWTECNQLDFLPFTCDLCKKVFCKDHKFYDQHECPASYQKDVRVPQCPVCNAIIPVQRGEDPNIKVNEHISKNCPQAPAPTPASKSSKQCHVRGCKRIDMIQVRCERCGHQFCLKHRVEQDHKCEGRRGQLADAATKRSNAITSSRPAPRPAQQRLTQKTADSRKPQQSLLNDTGRQLEQERRERQMRANAAASNAARSTPSALPSNPGSQQLSEDEALARALQASLEPTVRQSDPEPAQARPTAGAAASSEEDADLQRAIAASLQEQEQEQEKKDSCVIS